MDYLLYTQGKNVTDTANYFGVTRKTIHKWLKRYLEKGLYRLEEKSSAPLHVRTRQISLQQRLRIRSLRKIYPKYGR